MLGVAGAVAATGLAVQALHAGIPGYFGLIGLHAPLGLLFAAFAALLLVVSPAKGRVPLLAAAGTGVGGAVLAARGGAEGALALAALCATTLGCAGWGLVARDEDDARAATRLAAAIGLSAAAVGGALIAFQEGPATLRWQEAHSLAGSWAAMLLLLHLLGARVRRVRLPKRALLPAAAAAILGWNAAAWAVRPAASDLGLARLDMPSTEQERRESLDPASAWTRADPIALSGSASCGVAGCHEAITRQWAGSPHRFSAANHLYRAAIGGLLGQGRREAALFCAGCHDPVVALSGTLDAAYADGGPTVASEGVGCAVCHAIRRVHGTPPANGDMELDLPSPYPGTAFRQAARIRMDARSHALAWSENPATRSDSVCKPCHRVVVGTRGELALKYVEPPVEDDPDADSCADCHMPPAEGTGHAHWMPGIAVDLERYAMAGAEDRPLLAGHARAVQQGVGLLPLTPIDGPGWVDAPGGDREPPAPLLDLQVDASVDEAKDEVVLAVETHTTATGHAFPTGPWDLQQVWLEVRVADGQGRVLLEAGAVDSDGRILGNPVRLGALLFGADGHPIERHEILRTWDAIPRGILVAQGEPMRHALRAPLMHDSVYPFDVRARWMFRRVGRDYAAWAIPGGAPLPAWELVGVRRVIDER